MSAIFPYASIMRGRYSRRQMEISLTVHLQLTKQAYLGNNGWICECMFTIR
jgi:hypothetical protein